MQMEAANSTITATMGHLKNLGFTFSDINFFLQVQVMPNAPYEVLLGQPFYALTELISQDYASGEQHIQIRCPNTGVVMKLPTYEHKHNQKKKRISQIFSSRGIGQAPHHIHVKTFLYKFSFQTKLSPFPLIPRRLPRFLLRV